MKLVYTADLHGNPSLYDRLFAGALKEKAEAVVIGGDLLPKTGPHGTLIEEQRRFIGRELRPALKAFRAASPGAETFLMMGNDDFAVNMDLLEEMEREGLCRTTHMKVHALGEGLSLAGYACVRPTPFSVKDFERYDDGQKIIQPLCQRTFVSTERGLVEIDDREWFEAHRTIAQDLDDLAALSDPQKTIYVIHDPPYGTSLDMLSDGTHIGSMAVAAFVRQYRPPLVLSGHIHESPRISGHMTHMIGNTLCVNPGQAGNELQAVAVQIPGCRVRPLNW